VKPVHKHLDRNVFEVRANLPQKAELSDFHEGEGKSLIPWNLIVQEIIFEWDKGFLTCADSQRDERICQKVGLKVCELLKPIMSKSCIESL
jgi:hypothetical protein